LLLQIAQDFAPISALACAAGLPTEGEAGTVRTTGVLRSGIGGLRLNTAGFFARVPEAVTVPAQGVDLAPAAAAVLLGDLDLAAWQPVKGAARQGSGVLDAGVTLRGLVPAGSWLRWPEGARISEVALRPAALVGGRSLPADTRPELSNGCDIALTVPGESQECLDIADGKLTQP